MFSLNKKALFEYEIEQKFEAGIVLTGSEVKGIRNRSVNIATSHIIIEKEEVFILNMHIGEYKMRYKTNQEKVYNPLRKRKLLLNKKEINKIMGFLERKGFTCIALSCYEKKGKIKLEIAVAQGRKLHDKREYIKEKDLRRESKKNDI